MNLSIYGDAIKTLAVSKLTAFLKTAEDIVEIEGWSKLRAPEKRKQIMEAFGQSKELRQQFVFFYSEYTGKEQDFSEWETGDLPEEPQEQFEPPSGSDAPADETPADETPETGSEIAVTGGAQVADIKPSIFVEGAFGQIVSDVAGLDAAQSQDNLRDAEERLEFEHIRIGALLSHIQSSQHYVTLGYDNIREFLAAQTGLHYRKAAYLISNFNAVKNLGIEANELTGVTWSGLRHIIPVMNQSNYGKWLDMARNVTQAVLIQEVEKAKAKAAGALPGPDQKAPSGEEPQKIVGKVFNVNPDQNATLIAALNKAKTEGNVDSSAAALDIIASTYVGTPPSDATVASVFPDTSVEGFKAIFSKMKADGGNDALLTVLEAIDAIWSDVEIAVEFPVASDAA